MTGDFSANLARLRKERKLTQEKLAQVLGVSFQAVSKWETAQSYPDVELLPQLARLLATDINTLFGYTPVKRGATAYEERYGGAGFYWGVAPHPMCYDVMRLKPPTKPLRLLDVCCGEGSHPAFLPKRRSMGALPPYSKGRRFSYCMRNIRATKGRDLFRRQRLQRLRV
ncbi:MAG: helix-turn-helix domain-containing protein [Oscillospiraceae bacterium]|nr:helix-turn-helix domain-containing protein [Oscillospiraceae bacterium]